MRRLLVSRLHRIATVCLVSHFFIQIHVIRIYYKEGRCPSVPDRPNLPDFTLVPDLT